MSNIGNQLKSQSLGDVIPEAFKQVGSRVFPDTSAFDGLNDLVAVVDSYRATHLPAFGSVIPSTGVGVQAVPTSLNDPTDLVAPSSNEVFKVQAISILYTGVGASDFEVYLGDTLYQKGTAMASEHQPISYWTNTALTQLFVSNGQTLQIVQTSGDVDRLNCFASTVKTCL